MWIAILFCAILLYFIVDRSKLQRLYPPGVTSRPVYGRHSLLNRYSSQDLIHKMTGPTPLPVLGNILSVCLKLKQVKNHYKLWQIWSQQYGEILGLKMGLINVVVVSGKEYIREVSSREVFQGRPNGFLYTMRSFGKKLGLVFSDGPKWSKTRRFVLKYMKTFGYNTRSMENYIEQECKALVKLRMSDAGRPVLINTMFHVTIVNILWQLVAGKRYNLEDSRLINLCSLITKLFKAVDMSGGFLTFLPFLRHLIPDLIGYTKLRSIHKELHQFVEETIMEHRKSIDLKHPRDVIDAFIIEETSKQNDEPFTQEDLQVICLDLLEGGMETVSNTASFMLLHIVRNYEVQRKLHQEIDEMIGHDRAPMVNDRTRMVYTEAVLLETLRISTVAAVGIPHMALEDAQLGDYVIPKVDRRFGETRGEPMEAGGEQPLKVALCGGGLCSAADVFTLLDTFILLNMYNLHNGSHWKEPEKFRPERFLTKEGNLIQDEWLIPFGTGKRRCIGEGLARSELFMILTHLLQKFELHIPDGDPQPSTEPLDGLSLSAEPFRVIFKPRF